MTREYCDICGKETTYALYDYRIDFFPYEISKKQTFHTCKKCQKMIKKSIYERIKKNENQN